jgi:RNA polymerase sigma-70 factor (ECF subfamily)
MTSDLSDAGAVALARNGDSQAFRALVERHSRSLFRLAYRMTGNREDAEDVVQETFLRAYRQLHRFESRANFSTWLYRIAVNCSVDVMRARPRRETGHGADELEQAAAASPAAAAEASPDRVVFSAEVRERVTGALAELSALERAAFVLRHFEGLSIDEIGGALGLRTNATKHSIFRAVRKMRAALEPLMNAGAGRAEQARPTHGSA